MNNTTKIRVGDKVRFINQKAHEDMPSCYPAVGTCGKVLHVIEHAEDDIELRIQWDIGSTSGDDMWHCDRTSVEFVDSSYYKEEAEAEFDRQVGDGDIDFSDGEVVDTAINIEEVNEEDES